MTEKENLYDEIQLYKESFENLNSQRDRVDDAITKLQVKNIEQLRSFFLQIILMSAAIFISIFPLLIAGNTNIIGSIDLMRLGLIILVINSLFGIWHMGIVLSRENKNLDELKQFHLNEFNTHINLTINYTEKRKSYQEYGREKLRLAQQSATKEKEITNKNRPSNKLLVFFDKHFIDILTWGLMLGVLIIFFSFI